MRCDFFFPLLFSSESHRARSDWWHRRILAAHYGTQSCLYTARGHGTLCFGSSICSHSGKSRCAFIHDKQHSSVDCMMMWFRKYCFEYFWSWFLNNFLKIRVYACESQKEAAKCSGIGPCTDTPKRHCYRIWPRLSLMEAAAMIFSRQSSPFIFNADLFSPGAGLVWETWLAHRLIFQYQMCIREKKEYVSVLLWYILKMKLH